MKRLISLARILIICLLLPVAVYAEQAIIAQELQGTWEIFPETEDGACIVRYSVPQFGGEIPLNEEINRSLAEMFGNLEVNPDLKNRLVTAAEGKSVFDTGYRITRNDSDYLSLVITMDDGNETTDLFPLTFAKYGIYAGQRIGLSQVMGLETVEEQEDTELNQLICGLIWGIIRQETRDMNRENPEQLDYDAVERTLNPEWDFFLEENGNIVFVPSVEMEGMHEFPFLPEELLNAMK